MSWLTLHSGTHPLLGLICKKVLPEKDRPDSYFLGIRKYISSYNFPHSIPGQYPTLADTTWVQLPLDLRTCGLYILGSKG